MLEQIQPSRWSPTAWSSGTLLKKDHPRLAGGFNSVELVSAAAAASIFALLCQLCGACMGGLTGEPPAHLQPPALEPARMGT